MADKNINAMLAEKVLGWKRVPGDGVSYETLLRPDGVHVHLNDVPHFAESPADSEMLVAAVLEKHKDLRFTLESWSGQHEGWFSKRNSSERHTLHHIGRNIADTESAARTAAVLKVIKEAH